MIQLSLLQLKNFWIDEFTIKSIVAQDDTVSPESISMHLGANFKVEDASDNPRAFRLAMEIKFHPEADEPGAKTHDISLKIIGLFEILPQANEESFSNYKNLSAPSIMYGVARGFIAMMTAMSRPGKLVMPSLDTRTFLNAKPIEHSKECEPEKPVKKTRRRKSE